ncbi:MAG: peptidylprolyl isomerase [Candidatus Thalassarchaeum sp.]|jgi:FKBP-type peptidyl-prolyl cis-trans isomerase SlyD|nr:peptidylprolyl isomerase [Candidatus Thalassarchaeum sp.]MDP7003683.1 peptidylprolyl isomerase [Candidatus Thalassarchaeaceae archaeon]
MTDIVEQDSVATVHYTGTYPDGEVFDSSEGGPPLAFLVGHGNMIAGFEQEMMGATVGERREFTLTPDLAYGERDEDAIQQMEKSQFPPEMELEVGMVLAAHSDQGPIQLRISSIDGDLVTVDFNHQMAGKTLCFSVEVVEIRPATADEITHGHAHGPGGHHHH